MRFATLILLSLLAATCGQKGPLQRPAPSPQTALLMHTHASVAVASAVAERRGA